MNFKKDKDFAGHRNLTGIMDNPAILTQIRMASRCMSVKSWASSIIPAMQLPLCR